MQVFKLFTSRVLLTAVVGVLSASLVSADQNDRNKDNRGNGQSSRSSGGAAVRSSSSGNSGNSGSSGNSTRSFSSSNNSNNNVSRSFQSQGSRGRSSSNDSGNRSQQTVVRQTDSHSSGDAGQFSNKGNNNGQNVQSSSGSNSKGSVLGQQIQVNQGIDQQGTNSSNRSNSGSGRSFGQFRGNENTRIAENDDHKNKGDNKNNKGNNGQNNQGQNNQGQNNQNGRNGDNGKQQGDNSSIKTGVPFNGTKGQFNFPGSNNGPKFDIKNGDRHDRDFNHDKQDNHDGKHDDHMTAKDLFGHRTGDNHPNNDRNFHDRDFHGNDSAKVEFKKWNDVWKGKNGSGKDNRDWSGKWRSGDRFVAADAIRHDFFAHHDIHHDSHNMPFQASWWDSHHDHDHGWHFWGDYANHHHHHPWYWWSWASAPALATYCSFGWNTPYYWDYGQGEYIYCNNGNVYVNGRLYEPVPMYYAQTVRLIDQAPLLDADAAAQADWMPLGVFAVTPDGENQPSMIVQLAITKDGIIGGTATDQQAGTSFNIQGTVDQKTQRAVWSYVDAGNHRIVMESSINNLTQNESTGLIHYSANDQRVVEFVRMPEPNAQGELPMPQEVGMPAGGPGDEGPALPPPEQ